MKPKFQTLRMRKIVACALTSCALLIMLALQTTAPAKLAANKLAASRLSPYSAAANSAVASNLAASPIASAHLGANQYVANLETTRDFLATPESREVLSSIVSCALANDVTLLATAPVPSSSFPERSAWRRNGSTTRCAKRAGVG